MTTDGPLALPTFWETQAAAEWRAIDFISDLHLAEDTPRTFDAFASYLRQTCADAVFILGDLFDVWVGDDVLADGFEDHCCRTLRAAAAHRAVFFMHGNRDFLLGDAFAQTCQLTLLADPTVLVFGGQRWLLSHGDALCLDDRPYLEFRAKVRAAAWQTEFLARPLAERQAIAQGLRQQSDARKRSGISYGDVDSDAARQALHTAMAHTLIHGHTHQPADHDLGQGLRRIVLSDWDGAATPARAQVLRLRLDDAHLPGNVLVQRLDASQGP